MRHNKYFFQELKYSDIRVRLELSMNRVIIIMRAYG